MLLSLALVFMALSNISCKANEGVVTSQPLKDINKLAMFAAGPDRTGVYYAEPALETASLKWKSKISGNEAFSAPLVYKSNVFVLSLEGGNKVVLMAFDEATGKETWKTPVASMFGSAMAAGEDLILAPAKEGLVALDYATGQQKWIAKTSDEVTASPAIDGQAVYFGSKDHNLYAVDINSGKELWRFPTQSEIRTPPAVVDGTVYFGGGWTPGFESAPQNTDRNFYAVDAATGKEKWRYVAPEWKGQPDEGPMGGIALREEGAASAPAVSGGTVYFGAWNNAIYAVDAQTGQQKWKYSPEKDNYIYPQIAISEGNVLFVTEVQPGQGSMGYNNFYSLDSESGNEKWSFKTGEMKKEDGAAGSIRYRLLSTPSVSGGLVYFGSLDRNIYALDVNSGTKKWSFTADRRVHSALAIDDGNIFFSNATYVFALSGQGGLGQPEGSQVTTTNSSAEAPDNPNKASPAGLPENALVIEQRDLPGIPNRALFIWMLDPVRHSLSAGGDSYTCPQETRGTSYYEGPTRVSLLDTGSGNIINTISISDRENPPVDSFVLPSEIRQGYYYRVDAPQKTEAKPVFLDYRDVNVDGAALEFVLYDKIACGELITALIGYSRSGDQVIQYPINVSGNCSSHSGQHLWWNYLFAKQPVEPGHWHYSVAEGHGSNTVKTTDIRYDPEAESFTGSCMATG